MFISTIYFIIAGFPCLCLSFQLPIRLLFDEFNTLENIVSSQAIASTIISRMNMEIVNENILFKQVISSGHTRLNFDLFYLSILAASWYGRYIVDVDKVGSKLELSLIHI